MRNEVTQQFIDAACEKVRFFHPNGVELADIVPIVIKLWEEVWSSETEQQLKKAIENAG